MNTPNYRFLKTLALSLMITGTAMAQGHGTNGGGQVVMTPEGLQLRDLLSKQCHTRTGSELIEAIPELKERLATFQKIDWYFGFTLEREVRRMSFCFTDAQFNPLKLPRILEVDGILMTQAPQSTEFVAIRILQTKEAYVRAPLFEILPSRTQAMTILHETLHSFLPLEINDRDTRLRNFVYDLSALDASQSSSRKTLETSIAINRVDLHLGSRNQKGRKFFAYALGDENQKRQMILDGSINLNEILNAPREEIYRSFLKDDQNYLHSLQGKEDAELVAPYCEQQDEEVLEKLRPMSNDTFDVDLYCLSLKSTQDDLKAEPSATAIKAVNRQFQLIYSELINSKVEVRHERIQISPAVRFLSQTDQSNTIAFEALSLIPMISFADKAPVSKITRQYLNLILVLARSMPVQDWAGTLSQNGDLKKALSSQILTTQVQALTAPMNDEKRALLDLLPQVFVQFKSLVHQELLNQKLNAYAQAWQNITQ